MSPDIAINRPLLIGLPKVGLLLGGHELVVLPGTGAFALANEFLVKWVGHPDGNLLVLVPVQGVVALFAPILVSMVAHEEMFRVFAEFWQF